MRKPSIKHKAVVNLILSGKSLDETCLEVYPHRKEWSKIAREISISKILKLPHVKAYYDEQRKNIESYIEKKAKEDSLWTFNDSVEALKFVVKAAQRDAIEVSKRNQSGRRYECAMSAATSGAITRAVSTLNELYKFSLGDDESDTESGRIDAAKMSFIEAKAETEKKKALQMQIEFDKQCGEIVYIQTALSEFNQALSPIMGALRTFSQTLTLRAFLSPEQRDVVDELIDGIYRELSKIEFSFDTASEVEKRAAEKHLSPSEMITRSAKSKGRT